MAEGSNDIHVVIFRLSEISSTAIVARLDDIAPREFMSSRYDPSYYKHHECARQTSIHTYIVDTVSFFHHIIIMDETYRLVHEGPGAGCDREATRSFRYVPSSRR